MSGVTFGYTASAEQFPPRPLVDLAAHAEARGLELVPISDHFQPWRHRGGHSPDALPWLGAAGERTARARLGTSVLTPTLRYEPAIIAQAFAALACLHPGRVFPVAASGPLAAKLAGRVGDGFICRAARSHSRMRSSSRRSRKGRLRPAGMRRGSSG